MNSTPETDSVCCSPEHTEVLIQLLGRSCQAQQCLHCTALLLFQRRHELNDIDQALLIEQMVKILWHD